jgi:hypothetical protein
VVGHFKGNRGAAVAVSAQVWGDRLEPL